MDLETRIKEVFRYAFIAIFLVLASKAGDYSGKELSQNQWAIEKTYENLKAFSSLIENADVWMGWFFVTCVLFAMRNFLLGSGNSDDKTNSQSYPKYQSPEPELDSRVTYPLLPPYR